MRARALLPPSRVRPSANLQRTLQSTKCIEPAFSVARTTMRNIKRWRDAQDHPALDRGQHGGRTQTVPAGDGERLFHPFSERLAQLVNSVGGSYS